ncbi:MAG: hypothetical protein ACEY3J_00845 [Arsenophonus sp.]
MGISASSVHTDYLQQQTIQIGIVDVEIKLFKIMNLKSETEYTSTAR